MSVLWKYGQEYVETPQALADAFPECARLARRRVKELRILIKEYWRPYALGIESSPRLVERDALCSCNTRVFWRLALIKYIDHSPASRELDLLEGYLALLKLKRRAPQAPQSPQKHDTARAKAFPIQDILPLDHAREMSTRITACCPIHKEKTPSFVIYKKTNTFHCFGCGASGDSISFAMRIYDIDFIQAVEKLGG